MKDGVPLVVMATEIVRAGGLVLLSPRIARHGLPVAILGDLIGLVVAALVLH